MSKKKNNTNVNEQGKTLELTDSMQEELRLSSNMDAKSLQNLNEDTPEKDAELLLNDGTEEPVETLQAEIIDESAQETPKDSSHTMHEEESAKQAAEEIESQSTKKQLGKIETEKVTQEELDKRKGVGALITFNAAELAQSLGVSPNSGGPEDTDVEFMKPTTASHLRKPHHKSHIILYTILGFFACVLLWAHFATLDEITQGEGRVIPSGQIKSLAHLEGGIIEDILTKEGDVVEKGQVLLKIDPTIAESKYQQGISQYYQTWAQILRLKSLLAGTPLTIPEKLQKESPDIAAKELDNYKAAKQRLDNDKAIAEQEVEQRQQEANEAGTKLEQLKKRLELAEEEFRLTEPLLKSGIAPKMDGLRIQRDINDTKGDLATAQTNIPKTKAALLEAQQKLAQVEVNYRNDYYKELLDAERRWAELKDLTTTGLDRLSRTELRSPVRGIVKELKVHTIGAVVRPGDDLIDLVPLEDTLLIEAKVKPSDVAFLRPGMNAKVKITAYDFTVYGGLEAIVTDISPDSIVEQDNRRDTEKEFFKVTVRTNKNHLGTEDNPLPISPGMTAQVDILTGKKTVLQYILMPIIRAKQGALTER